MRILFITAETWPSFRADVAMLFSKYLPRHGIQSYLVTGRTPDEPEQPWGGGAAILVDVCGGQAKKHLKTFLHIWRTLARLDSARHDAVQVRDLPLPATLALWAARRKRLPFYYWMSYRMPEGQIALARARGLAAGLMKFLFPWVRGSVGRFLLYRVVLPCADHVFVQSPKMRENIARMGITVAKMTPAPMGVPPRLLDWLRVPRAEVVPSRVLYLGTLAASRKLEILAEAFARVREEFPHATLMFVGDGDFPHERADLECRVRELGPADAVTFAGFIPMEQAWQWVATAEICVSPIAPCDTLDVASPTKLVEYIAFGKPLVVNTHPEQTQLLHACDVGELVPWSAEGFADGIRRLLADTVRAAARAAEGPGWVRTQGTYDHIAETVLARYRALTGQDAAAEPIAKPSHTETP